MLYPELAHKKIFLTGGTGFFGKSILAALKNGILPHTEFVILSRDPERFAKQNPELTGLSNVRFHAGDVRDFVFPDEKFDIIFHAATPAVTTLPPGEMRSIIIDGTQRVLRFARQCGAGKILLTSSGAVYGPQPPDMENIPENHPCKPVTEYGIAKLEAESMCVQSGIYTLIARCFAFCGPYLPLDIHFAIGNFIRDGLLGKNIAIQGDGRPYRSYMAADDLVHWLFTILAKGEHARPYNVGSPEGISIADLARTVAAQFSPAPQVTIALPPGDGPAPRYVPDVSRAQQELGLDLQISLTECIRQVIAFHR